MTQLIKGCTILKSTSINSINGILYRYRLVLGIDRYIVHVEYRESSGASGEMILIESKSLESANFVYNRYSKT